MKWWHGLIIAAVLGLVLCCILGAAVSFFLIPSTIQSASWGRAAQDIRKTLEAHELIQQQIGMPVQLAVTPEYSVLIDDPDVIAWTISGDEGNSILIARIATDATADKDMIDWALLRSDRQELLDLAGHPPRKWIQDSLGDDLADQVVEAYRPRLEELLGSDPIAWIDWLATNEADEAWTVVAVSGQEQAGSIELKIIWDEEEEAFAMNDATLERDDDQRYYLGDSAQERPREPHKDQTRPPGDP